MITFNSNVPQLSVRDVAVTTIMRDVRVLENAGYKIIRIEGNFNLKNLLFPNATFEDFIPGFADYELGTLVPAENAWEPSEMPKYRIVVEEVTEDRFINFGD